MAAQAGPFSSSYSSGQDIRLTSNYFKFGTGIGSLYVVRCNFRYLKHNEVTVINSYRLI